MKPRTFLSLVALVVLVLYAGLLRADETCYDTCSSWVCDTGQYWVDEYCDDCTEVCDTCADCWEECHELWGCWWNCGSYPCNCHTECSSYVCGGHWETYETNCRWEDYPCNPHPCPPPPEWCGDGACNNGETCGSCSQDCGTCVYCGNGTCDLGTGEDCGTCLQDCPCWDPNFPVCENRQCVAPPPVCGNGTCDLGTGEDCGTCLQDCPCWDPNFPVCQNRQCVAPPEWCGDGACNNGESCDTCAQDCGSCPYCGNGTCDLGTGEDCGTCLEDCPCWDPNFPVCENRQCVAAPEWCGDGACNNGETCGTCEQDCGSCPYCGNGSCDLGTGEDCGTCLQDCPCWDPNFPVCENRQCMAAPPLPAECGNGVPDPGEDCQSCPRDIAVTPGYYVSPQSVQLGQAVTFSVNPAHVLDPPAPLWDMGNTVHLDGTSLTYTYPAAGTYSVVLTSTENRCGTTQLSAPATVFVLPNDVSCDFSDLPPERWVCCGSGVCDPGENPNTCPSDCETTCGDGFCVPERGETPMSCALDCCASQTTCPAGCAPLPAFTVSEAGPVIAQPVVFSAFPDSISGTTVNWDFGDGAHCVQCPLTVTHTYATPGDRTVILTATENVCFTTQVSHPQVIRVYDRAIKRGDDATLVASNLPTTMQCQTTQQVSIQMQNTGNTTWTSEAGYFLGAVDDEDPFAATTRIPLPAPVAPLGFITFTFTLDGGSHQGVFSTDWRMVHDGVGWFGDVAQSQVVVPPAGCGLDAYGTSLELSVACGERVSAALVVENTGTVSWTPEGDFALTVVEGEPLTDEQRIPVTETVAPGETYTFEFDVVGLGTPGQASALWRMTEGELLFGSPVNEVIEVPPDNCNPPTARGFLDDGTSVYYDNLSSMTTAKVEDLIRKADRSTRTACIDSSNKGLFNAEDRIVVTDHYIAWLDHSTNEGVAFPVPPEAGPIYRGPWERSGALAGFWSLEPAADPAQTDFRYKTTIDGCQWPHNQLLPGSASPAGRLSHSQKFFWDKFSPPSEVCAVVSGPSDLGARFFCHHYARHNGNSGWGSDGSVDGTRDAEGRLHYKTQGRLANAYVGEDLSRTHSVDVFDGDDGGLAGIQNFIDSSLEYVFGPEDIRLIWDFRPASADVVLQNNFMYLWASYGQSEDDRSYGPGLWCDKGKEGTDPNSPGYSRQDWPRDGEVWDQPLFAMSSEPLQQNWTGASFTAGQVAHLELGPACPPDEEFFRLGNRDLYTLGAGSWLAMGASSSVSTTAPRWVYSHEGTPGSGDGSQGNPVRIAWPRLAGWNELRDGTVGFGVDKQEETRLQAGKWYRGEYCVGVGSACGRGPTP